MPAGRPPIYSNVEELSDAIDDYFYTQDSIDEPYTICGLALHLGLTRQTLINYEGKEEFFDTIKKAKLRVEAYLEKRLLTNAPTGAIFNLKNNFSWADERKHQLSNDPDSPITPVLNVTVGDKS